MTSSSAINSFAFEETESILISSTAHITYLTGYSSFSSQEREAYLLLTKNKKYIFTDARYTQAVKEIDGFELLEITGEINIADHLKKIVSQHQIKSLGIEGESLTVSELRLLEKVVKSVKEIKLHQLRGVKSQNEIAKIEAACKLGDKAFKYILKKIKPGISERKLALEIEMYIRKQGAVPSFNTIAAFGDHSSVPHHGSGKIKLRGNGEFVLMDFGSRVDNYCSDMTRTVFLGSAKPKQKKMYKTVLNAQKKAVDFLDNQIKKGQQVMGREVDRIARDYIISQGFPPIPHSLGHGIGLEVHEYPRLSPKSDDALVEGMVFSIEPGIYISGYGGVRIEDLYVIEKKGLRRLTKSPRDLIEL
jgi:Xaa-Pro aminopeptidase